MKELKRVTRVIFGETANNNCKYQMFKSRIRQAIEAYGLGLPRNGWTDLKAHFGRDHFVLETFKNNQPHKVLQIFVDPKRDNGGYFFSVRLHDSTSLPFLTNNLGQALDCFKSSKPKVKNGRLSL